MLDSCNSYCQGHLDIVRYMFVLCSVHSMRGGLYKEAKVKEIKRHIWQNLSKKVSRLTRHLVIPYNWYLICFLGWCLNEKYHTSHTCESVCVASFEKVVVNIGQVSIYSL